MLKKTSRMLYHKKMKHNIYNSKLTLLLDSSTPNGVEKQQKLA